MECADDLVELGPQLRRLPVVVKLVQKLVGDCSTETLALINTPPLWYRQWAANAMADSA